MAFAAIVFFGDGEVLRLDMMLRVEIYSEASQGEAAYRLSWWPEEPFDFLISNQNIVPGVARMSIYAAIRCGEAKMLSTASQLIVRFAR